jgi:hypothetical protein
MSHARRHFRDALNSNPARMSVVLALIAQLYRVESMARKKIWMGREALRGFAIGRNNWMFFGSDSGGRIAAVLRSFVVSCELVKAIRSPGSAMCSAASTNIECRNWTNCCRTAGRKRNSQPGKSKT